MHNICSTETNKTAYKKTRVQKEKGGSSAWHRDPNIYVVHAMFHVHTIVITYL